jgi:hypothetical protein
MRPTVEKNMKRVLLGGCGGGGTMKRRHNQRRERKRTEKERPRIRQLRVSNGGGGNMRTITREIKG